MAQVVRVKGKIVQVRDVDRGETVGYGAEHRMDRGGRIATVAVGYADGWFRSSQNRALAGIAGRIYGIYQYCATLNSALACWGVIAGL